MLAAWARRNSRHPGPDLRGAGPSPGRASGRRTVVGDTGNPSLASSPPIRRCPQRGFSRASRSTRARTSAGTGGRPRLPGGGRHFLRTSARCQRSSVRGDQTRAARRTGQVAGRRREPRPINGAKLRPRHRATEDLKLVAQDQQLEVLDGQATATADERSEQGPEHNVEKREGHPAILPALAQTSRDTTIGALHAHASAPRPSEPSTASGRPSAGSGVRRRLQGRQRSHPPRSPCPRRERNERLHPRG